MQNISNKVTDMVPDPIDDNEELERADEVEEIAEALAEFADDETYREAIKSATTLCTELVFAPGSAYQESSYSRDLIDDNVPVSVLGAREDLLVGAMVFLTGVFYNLSQRSIK